MVGPSIMLYGTDEQKAQYLPEIASGDAVYCQGFSEPESGSDLASLQLRAVEDGDDFVLNGSKIWTSGAQRANRCYIMVRTDPEAPKHRGISVFIVDMDTPGIEVAPIINMFGVHYFNQVFFENVRVPKRNMIGEINKGWYVAATTLDFERSGVGRYGSNRRDLEELAGLSKEIRLNGSTLNNDQKFRRRLAELWTANEAGRMVAYNVAWMQSEGLVPNKEASAAKLVGSEISQRISQLGMQMLGMYGLLDEGSKWAYINGRIAQQWMDSVSLTIRAGTSEIQRNINRQPRAWGCREVSGATVGRWWQSAARSARCPRYGVDRAVNAMFGTTALGTFAANISGSFLLGAASRIDSRADGIAGGIQAVCRGGLSRLLHDILHAHRSQRAVRGRRRLDARGVEHRWQRGCRRYRGIRRNCAGQGGVLGRLLCLNEQEMELNCGKSPMCRNSGQWVFAR